MKHLLNGLAVVALMAVAAPVAAREAGPRAVRNAAPVTEAEFIQNQTRILRAADANGDGQVTAEELRAHTQARRAERLNQQFARLDANGDGQISREEFAAQSQRRTMNREGRNRAGAERPAMAIATAEQRARERFAAMDTNRDGQVTVEERRAAFEAMRKNRGEQRRMHRAPQASQSPADSE